MALALGVVDVPLTSLSQVASDTMGPLGRLQHVIDAQVKKYEPHYVGTGGVVPAKVKVEPRDPFVSMPTAARSVVDGSVATPVVTPPELLSPLGSQLVSISNGQPRVWNGKDWSFYPGTQIVTRKLSQDVLHTSQHTIQAPDSAWINGVTCVVWTETVVTSSGPLTSSFVGFQSDTGAWVVTPTLLFAAASTIVTALAKVVTDGSHFFVFYNDGIDVLASVYDTNGAVLGTIAIPLPTGTVTPGPWDVIASPTTGGYTVIFAQNAAFTGDHGVTFTAVGWNGSAIIQTSNTDATIHADFNLAWLTNDSGNGLAYLATTLSGGSEAIWAYEITNLAQTHVYNTGVAPTNGVIDSITGYAAGTSVINLIISYSQLATNAAATGPKHDPQRRLISSFAITRAGSMTPLRTTQSMCQVSRAFVIDGQYYVYGYYQSGSGIVFTQQTLSVTPSIGDFMVGAPVQPIAVVAGDSITGSPISVASSGTLFGPTVTVTTGSTAESILSGDIVKVVTVTGFGSVGIPDGTLMLSWTFAHLAASSGYVGSRITVAGSSIAAANTTWDVSAVLGTSFLTPLQDVNLSILAPSGTFTTTGTVTAVSMVAYETASLATILSAGTVGFYIGGTLKITGASSGNNVSAAPIARISYGQGGPNYFGGAVGAYALVWVAQTTQSTHTDTFQATLTASAPNQWSFASGEFDHTFIGADLVVTANPALPANVGTYPITATPNTTQLVTGGATALLPQIFNFPFPTIEIQLTTQIAYTFKFASVTPDYTYQGALVSVQGAADPANNGVYQIIQINADGSFIATPTNGLSNQVNEAFGGSQTITFFFNNSYQPPVQSTWYLVPISGSQPVVGRFEYGLAYADWRTEGDSELGPNLFPMALTSVAFTTSGIQVTLPYRAQNVTSSVVQITAAGAVDIGDESFSSTVGLKRFWLENAQGQAYQNSGELLIPGPMASVFTPSGFREDNFNLGMEAPFLVSQSVAAGGQLALTQGAIFFVVAVLEGTDENGNRIYSPPSPALQVSMSGTNNVATYGGRLPYPIGTTGGPVANTYGPTIQTGTLSLYKTAFINGVPTTQRYKMTLDLNPNGLAPVSSVNPSGFSFPDSFTWNYVDQNPDSSLTANEILYTDKGYLPRYPAPAFVGGVASWKNREWVIGYDAAIWMSGEKTEGDSVWFNPAFRYILPTDDEPMALAAVEDYLIVFCARSVWYIPAAQFPDATGANGGLPTPVQLPFPNGSANGLACTIRDGAAYDSTAGGLWMVTRNLENVWLGEPVKDTLTGTITGLTLDGAQRLFVQQSGSTTICVYDRVPQAWYEWRAPTQGILLATFNGQAAYQDSANVNLVTPAAAADLVNGVTSGIAMDITLAPLNIGNVRGLKRVWEFQGVGEYRGPHRMNVVLSYPEDDQTPTTYAPFVPVAGKPYVLPFNPMKETAAQFGIRFYVDFVGVVSPGESCTLEMVSAQVGMEPTGLTKRPAFVTMVANH